MSKSKQKTFIAKTVINSFHYLAQDAEFLAQCAAKSTDFDRVRFCRTAVLLYVFSLEALINRCMDHFLPEQHRDFFIERERRLSPVDKFELVPMLVTGRTFDKSDVAWAKLKELFRMRDDFVHPKHDRTAYLKVLASNVMEPLDPGEQPEELGISDKDLEYATLGIPKDPYSILPEHLARVKDATAEVMQKLNDLLDGRVFHEKWHITDQMELIYPKGASWKDASWSPTSPRYGKELRAGITEKK
jgi:hypothetical protein